MSTDPEKDGTVENEVPSEEQTEEGAATEPVAPETDAAQPVEEAAADAPEEGIVYGDPGDDDDEVSREDDWASQMEAMPEVVKKGDIVKGTVVAVEGPNVIIDIGAKSEGFVPRAEFPTESDLPAPDSEIEVAVVRVNEDSDTIQLSKRRADYERCWNELEEKAKENGIVEAMVTERVKGGLRVDVGVSGFIPASHVATRNVRALDTFVGRSLRLKVLEADRRQKKVILSHRQLVDEEREKRRAETLERLHEGAICEGKVRSIANYGAFVDLGGIDGLLHISEMAWTRIGHPSEVVKVGEPVRVIVLEIKEDGNRISLGMRQILPDPWKETAKSLSPGSVVKAKITRLVRTGAFAQLDDAGIEGFIPIREMSEKRIGEPSEVLTVGQSVDLKILDVKVQARRMSLSLVAAVQEKERQEYRKYMATQETAKPTLGDQFGDVLASLKADDEDASEEQEPPAEEAPAEEAPVEEPPVEEPPAEEAPVEEAPAEEPPAEEPPVEDEAPEAQEQQE